MNSEHKEWDVSLNNPQTVIRSVQRTAKVVFEDERSVLIEFVAIHDMHSGGKTPPPRSQPPDTTKK